MGNHEKLMKIIHPPSLHSRNFARYNASHNENKLQKKRLLLPLRMQPPIPEPIEKLVVGSILRTFAPVLRWSQTLLRHNPWRKKRRRAMVAPPTLPAGAVPAPAAASPRAAGPRPRIAGADPPMGLAVANGAGAAAGGARVLRPGARVAPPIAGIMEWCNSRPPPAAHPPPPLPPRPGQGRRRGERGGRQV